MKSSWYQFGCVFLMLIGSACLASSAAAQDAKNDVQVKDIVIVNQDGEKVKGLKVTSQVGDAGSRIQVKGDKIVIVGADGKKQEIDISKAASVQVQQSVQTTDNNGDRKSVVRGKAVIIGPDGERKVIELDGPVDGALFLGNDEVDGLLKADNFSFKMGEKLMPGQFQWRMGQFGKYMIGVNCEPISDVLRAHLQLEGDAGLVVKSVSKDAPAEKAGVQKHDILLSAGDRPLVDNQALIDVVQKAGDAATEVQIVAVRKGKEITLKVKPTERKMKDAMMGDLYELQFDKMGPGIVMPKAPRFQVQPGAFGDEFKAMREEMARIREELKELRNRRFKKDDN